MGRSRLPCRRLSPRLCICIVFVPVWFITGAAKSLFTPLAMSVIFAMLTSYLLSRTLVPTLVHYLLESEVEMYGGVEQEGVQHDHSAHRLHPHVGIIVSMGWALTVWAVLLIGAFHWLLLARSGVMAAMFGATSRDGRVSRIDRRLVPRISRTEPAARRHPPAFWIARHRPGRDGSHLLHLPEQLDLADPSGVQTVLREIPRRFMAGFSPLRCIIGSRCWRVRAVRDRIMRSVPRSSGRTFSRRWMPGRFACTCAACRARGWKKASAISPAVEAFIRTQIPPEEVETIIDNIGIPNSGINMSLSDGSQISPADGEILISLKENHHPTAGIRQETAQGVAAAISRNWASGFRRRTSPRRC